MATVSIASLDANKAEGNSGATPFTFIVKLDQALPSAVTVDYRVAQSTRPKLSIFELDATADDFVGGAFPTGTVTFLPGETSKIVTIDVAGDLAFESMGVPEHFAVFLSNPSNGLALDPDSTGGPNPVDGAIVNDETQTSIYFLYMFGPGGGPPFIYTTQTQLEGNSGTTDFSFIIRRVGPLPAESVTYSVSGFGDNPATASDFVGGFPQGVVTFAENEAQKNVSFSVVADTEFEPTETFAISLSNPSVGTIGATTAYGIVIDDDAPVLPTVAMPDTYVAVQGEMMATGLAVVRLNDLNGGIYTTVSLESSTSHGDLILLWNGAFWYTPAAGFSGVDSFIYRASDGLPESGAAEVTIRVVPVSDAPIPTLNLAALTPEEQIAAVYVATLGRAADADGLAYWLDQLTHGTPEQGPRSLQDIAVSIALSDEAKTSYPYPAASSGNTDTFVTVAYDTLFNRPPNDEGLDYWGGQIEQRLALGQFDGSIMVDIMAGARNTQFLGLDISTLMQKVTVSLAYVQAQRDLGSQWTLADDRAEAVTLIDRVGFTPETLLIGIAQAKELVAADIL